MAQLFPDFDTILKLHQKPTDGELKLINFVSLNTGNNFYDKFFKKNMV